MVEPQVNAVEAARRVLIEIIRLLEDHGVSGVVIGDWAADLLPSKGYSSHCGSETCDVFLSEIPRRLLDQEGLPHSKPVHKPGDEGRVPPICYQMSTTRLGSITPRGSPA